MGDENNKSLSISFRVDNGVIEHNNRFIIAKYVDASRISDNITYTQVEIKEFYHQIFGKSLAEYNAAQKRANKRIDGGKKSGDTEIQRSNQRAGEEKSLRTFYGRI